MEIKEGNEKCFCGKNLDKEHMDCLIEMLFSVAEQRGYTSPAVYGLKRPK